MHAYEYTHMYIQITATALVIAFAVCKYINTHLHMDTYIYIHAYGYTHMYIQITGTAAVIAFTLC